MSIPKLRVAESLEFWRGRGVNKGGGPGSGSYVGVGARARFGSSSLKISFFTARRENVPGTVSFLSFFFLFSWAFSLSLGLSLSLSLSLYVIPRVARVRPFRFFPSRRLLVRPRFISRKPPTSGPDAVCEGPGLK